MYLEPGYILVNIIFDCHSIFPKICFQLKKVLTHVHDFFSQILIVQRSHTIQKYVVFDILGYLNKTILKLI